MSEIRPDVLVIGAGPGGYVAAIRLGQLGKRVIVAEQARAGGICLNLGCIPTKALLHAVHTLHLAREGVQLGLKFGEPQIDIAQLGAWRNRVVERLVRGVEYLLKQNGVELIPAHAEFLDDKRVRLTHPDGTALTVEAESVIIATGSEPYPLTGMEPNGETIITSNEAVMLKSVPGRIVIVGAGAIGLEFASIYAGLGSQTIVVEIMDQVLQGTDRDLAIPLERILKKRNIQILLQTKLVRLEGAYPFKVVTNTGDRETSFEADQVLVAVGRRPLTRGLAIENSGVKLSPKGFIEVNERLQTTVPGVFAIGDVARTPLLAHKASREGIAVAEQIAGLGAARAVNLRAVPNCVYTDPELATVGMTEAEAQQAGYEVAVGKVPLSAIGRSATINRSEGLCKVVADAKTDKVLGVHILAPEASSLIGEGALAVELGLTAQDIGRTTHPHPSFGELLMETAEAVHRQAIHIPNPK
jgi:dihydrolipoamide dehydrogenase